ncbi:PE family protein [Mycobacterium intermedium]|uniref:PE family protein n=1 Tax=Mycobacterium intermedium TaxID=28445 RepID=A0A1E3SIA9_MYCIE|nr:PE family protein [Mycobacterium intermedium]MCV6964405.1 PE family protein [Mycobacterium intermedium]ODR01887.1 PE family protein [Mycobacterium intermedium]OPE49499.1 PE family protein [Mycobacterium intermedium]ORB08617.1 PE family protein [Mycobacterium intermedium]
MSYVTTHPEALALAAGQLHSVGSAMAAQDAAAAPMTTSLAPAATDPVSTLTAAQFSAHAALYQAVSAQAAAIHEMFVATLDAAAGSYAATEAANAITTR